MKRNRGRNRRSGGGGHNPNRHYESTGPDVKIRGSAQQILEKYQQYARDAQSAGDRVAAENYLQHAEHYYRIVASMQPKDRPQNTNASNQDDDSDVDTDADTDDDNDTDNDASDTDGNDGKGDRQQGQGRRNRRNRRERREPREDSDSSDTSDDPLKVVADGEAKADKPQQIGKSDDAGSDDEKPKRRTYRRKAEASDSDDDAGVRAIIGRGASKKAAEKAEADAGE